MADIKKELENLRNKIADIVVSKETWDTLHGVCQSLGLLSIEDNSPTLGKAKYLYKVTKENSDSSIISAAQKILINYPSDRGQPSEADLQEIQDSLWWLESKGNQQISNVTRIRIVECLNGIPFWGRLSLRDFFYPILPSVGYFNMPDIGLDGNLYLGMESQIFANLISGRNSTKATLSKISVLDYLQELGLSKWPDKRFCLFIERILHPEVQPPDKQKSFVNKFDKLLNQDGFKLYQESEKGGLPVYKVQKGKAGVTGTPKYIIFASSGPKPDIVINDAVNMDIRIVENANYCLIYDQPPTNGDLTWQMLLEWWGKKEGVDPKIEKVRQDFGLRLRSSLQSEPERMLFDTYFREYKKKLGDSLPALLPQVYLHYDPRSQIERGKPVLVRQRMDFLMLLRDATRIVIEIDGKQHYTNEDGSGSPLQYAEMVVEDRRIKLLGYEIYRFGGAEFTDPEKAHKAIITFFDELFSCYEIPFDHNLLWK
jgi:very-short-patch-repair endonuclease